MDSFAQQMLKEIDQRCKAYQLSNSSINLNEEFNNIKKIDIDLETKTATSNENISDEPSKCEIIYANSNVINQNEIIVSNNSVPVGRKKPALPPNKPNPLRLSLLKPKGYSCITANSNGKLAKIKIDPAELSLKERLALFEKNKQAVLVPESLDNKTEIKLSVTNKPVPNNFKHKGLHSPYVPHTKNLIKRIHQQKTIICDIDIDSEDVCAVTDVCESQIKHDIEKNTTSEAEVNVETIQTANNQEYDVIDSNEKSSPEMQESHSIRHKDALESMKPKLHIENGDTNREKYQSNEVIRSSKYACDIRLYGDLTPIVTTIVPNKLNPEETIGLNDLHPSNYSLISESNQYQPKEEDRWDRFIECLLFFCCVA